MIDARTAWLGLLLAAVPAPSPGAPAAGAPAETRFVGPAKCRNCHFPEHRSWSAGRMAKAFELLKPGERAEAKRKAGLDPAKDYTADPACLPCHTTGYGRPGGFVDFAGTPEMAGAGCEACHGAGSEYLKAGRMTLSSRDYRRSDLVAAGLLLQSAANCRTLCHNETSPTHKPFDYAAGIASEVHARTPLKFKHD